MAGNEILQIAEKLFKSKEFTEKAIFQLRCRGNYLFKEDSKNLESQFEKLVLKKLESINTEFNQLTNAVSMYGSGWRPGGYDAKEEALKLLKD